MICTTLDLNRHQMHRIPDLISRSGALIIAFSQIVRNIQIGIPHSGVI